ncbi:CaiB/BaiF CoA transferase family protein [Rhodococcus coprophilus]|uniref:CaiB/BaiF family protein n=1 Tax=Rhodococcus coprophilus TaxID=38310 RepID=A0A2X4UJI0_9NOCA|nr:CaiB/BaiF CoA-transferase family protein [Rhodococcus coprophilus]MBM7459289.1 formyl-CoA transferase [Rhodococcus coprophilus]SQI35738.1 CaiB/BaiF family protein [Rhodococcus coprophilus]
MTSNRSEAAATGELPLEGLTVVSLEQAVAAPLATRHLADLGARVVKVERVGDGDFARDYDSAVRGLAAHFVWLNRGKESFAVDVKSPAGIDAVKALVAGADVFVQNLAPGAADRLGLGADVLRADHPELVVVNMSGYGTDGPMRDRKAYDLLVQSETGLCSITGTPETAVKTGIPTSDIAAGMYALTSIQAALLRRHRTGVGATIDVSMFDATAEWLGYPMYLQMYQDRQVPRMGLAHTSITPYDKYPTSDGEILIGVQNDRGWRTLVTEVLGLPDLANDPRYATNVERVRRRHEVDKLVGDATSRFTAADLDEKLAAAGIPAAQLRDLRGLIEHPQITSRDRWRDVDTEAGVVRGLLPPMNFRDVELPMRPVPALGQHTDAVLAGLGLTDAQITGLRDAGIVG